MDSSISQIEKAIAITTFDSLVLTKSYNLVEIKSHKGVGQRNDRLVYDTNMVLYNGGLKFILDNPIFTENEKIEFLRQALMDTSKDAFHYITSDKIDFWRNSQKGTELINEYFRSKNFEASTDRFQRYKYLEFKVLSKYPESEQLIDKYFENRPEKNERCINEHQLLQGLIELKKEEKALKYLNLILMDAYIGGNIDYGIIEIIERLCLSENVEVSSKATSSILDILYKVDFETYRLYKLIAFVDKNSYLEILNTRFEIIKNIDFSPFVGQDLSQVPVSFRRESNKFFSFLFQYSKDLGKKRGQEIWNLFSETIEFWDSYGQPLEMSQLQILENCLLDEKLTVPDKIKMISKAKFTENMKNGNYAKQYLAILESIQPINKFNPDVAEQLHISKIDASNLETYQFETSKKIVNLADIQELNNDLNNYAKANHLSEIHLSNYQSFYYLDKKYAKTLISDFFKLNNRLVGINYDTPDFTPDAYLGLTQGFQQVLNYSLNVDLNLTFNSHQYNEKIHEYDFTIALKDEFLKYPFTEEPYQWNPSRLIEILNINLIRLNNEERFINVAEEGTGGIIIYAKSDELKKILNKYNIKCYAVEWNDEFSKK